MSIDAYHRYRAFLLGLVGRAAPEAQRRFALDTIQQLERLAAAAIRQELQPDEAALLHAVLGEVTRPVTELARRNLDALYASMASDDVRAIEFDHVLNSLLECLTCWLAYCDSPSPEPLVSLGMAMIDYVDSEDCNFPWHLDLELSDVLEVARRVPGTEPMLREFSRQQRLLAEPRST